MRKAENQIHGNRRRILAMTIAVLLLFSTAPVSALPSDTPSSWAVQELNQARNNGLVIPAANRNFQGNINRELFCELVVNMIETVNGREIQMESINPFIDTNNVAVIKAYQLGVVNGTSATQFSPNNFITREQIAAMMMRAARVLDLLNTMTYTEVPPLELEQRTFADQDQISAYALSDIRLANYLGIMQGVGGSRINPKGNTTVEQSIMLINRLYERFIEFRNEDNRPPSAIADPVVFNVAENSTMPITAGQIATDPDGDELTIMGASSNASIGQVLVLDDGTATYTSNDIDADTSYTFGLFVYDGKAQTLVNIRVNVLANATVNSSPVALSNPVLFSILEQNLLTISVGQLATDPDGDTLTITGVIGESNGTVALAAGGATSFTYKSQNITEGKTENLTVSLSDGIDTIQVQARISVIFVTSVEIPLIILKPSLASVTIEGDLGIGAALEVKSITYTPYNPPEPPTIYYNWLRSDTSGGLYSSVYSGSTATTYTLKETDVGKYFKLFILASGSATGRASSYYLGPVEDRLYNPFWRGLHL